MSSVRPKPELEIKPAPNKNPYKTYSKVDVQRRFSTSHALFHHDILIVNKPAKLKDAKEELSGKRNQKEWFCKTIDLEESWRANLLAAESEAVAQEFFRLLMPWHPKTRVWFRGSAHKVYILSEGIKDFDDLASAFENLDWCEFKEAIFEARSDFAELLVTSLYLNEFDFKLGNIGFNLDGRLVKIDGESCFAEYFDDWENEGNHCFTAEDLQSLPNLSTYHPLHWFLQVANFNRMNVGYGMNVLLASDATFRHAVNRCILKILVLPDPLIKAFVSSYVGDARRLDDLVKTMVQRRVMLLTAALGSDSFFQYTQSDQAKQDLDKFTEQLKQFKTMGKAVLYEQVPDMNKIMAAHKQQLQHQYDGFLFCRMLFRQEFVSAFRFFEQHPDIILHSWSAVTTGDRALHAIVKGQLDVPYLQKLCETKHDVNLSIENSAGKTPLSLAAYEMNFAAVKYFLTLPKLVNELSAKQLGQTLLFLLLRGNFELGKLLLEKYPHIDVNAWKDCATGNYVIHLAFLKAKPDFDFIQKLCQAGAKFDIANLQGLNPLTIAVAAKHYQIIEFLLDKYINQFKWSDVSPAIQCLMEAGSADKICVLNYVRYHTLDSLEEKRKYCADIIAQVIAHTQRIADVYAIVKKLEFFEEEKPFLKMLISPGPFFSLTQWKGKDASKTWARLMTLAHERIVELAAYDVDSKIDPEVYAFLKEPVSKWGMMFATSSKGNKEAKEIKEARSLPQLKTDVPRSHARLNT